MDHTLPYLTQTLGFHGVLKDSPGDFLVEELPLYEACGDGEHLYLHIEKCGVATPELVKHVARTLRISAGEIGIAGRKDRQAITRQFISLPARACPEPSVVETDQIRVLSAQRHRNKLRTGHLRGNRFRIVIRDVPPNAVQLATETATAAALTGFPNYFGEQRFGIRQQNDVDGMRLLKGELKRRLSADELRFTLSAAQSRLFNDWAGQRIQAGHGQRVLCGDVMQVVASGGCFLVEDQDAEQARFDRRETVITGPMFGPKMLNPVGEPRASEQAVLMAADLVPESFEKFAKLTSGTRRPFLVWPEELAVQAVPDGLEFSFALPPGAYATTILREFFKDAGGCALSSETSACQTPDRVAPTSESDAPCD